MSELDDLERDLLETANVWFAQSLHLKLQRLIASARQGERVLIAIARQGERAMARLDEWVAKSPCAPSVPVRREPTTADPLPPLPTVTCENGE